MVGSFIQLRIGHLNLIISYTSQTQCVPKTELIDITQRPTCPSVFPSSVNGFVRHYSLSHYRPLLLPDTEVVTMPGWLSH